MARRRRKDIGKKKWSRYWQVEEKHILARNRGAKGRKIAVTYLLEEEVQKEEK